MGVNSTFKEAVERATSPTLLEPDWVAILQVCDSIRQQDVTGKIAVSEIKKKIFDSNPHVSKNAIITLEACVKNCGAIIHEEVASKLLMDDFRQYLKTCPDTVKSEILRIIQAWAHGFRNEPKYKVIEDTRNLLKMEGYSFPERNESDAMFSALKAPDWVDGEVCHRCRVKFSTFNRQHHCRCCGQVFCHKCSSKVSTVPKFGIERDVRVCDPCYDQLNPGERSSATSQPPSQPPTSTASDLPAEYLKSDLAKEAQVPEKKSADEIKRQEQDDLQLAMALSVSEQESKPTSRPSSQPSSLYSVPETKPSAPAIPSSYSNSSPSMHEEEEEVDPDLARYLNRPYWESRKEANDAPSSNERPVVSTSSANEEPVKQLTEVTSTQESVKTPQERETEAFMKSLRTNIENLTQRMKYVTGKGRHVSTDTITQSLLQTVNTMHPQLMALVEKQEQEKEKHEGMQDKLGVLEETRQCLDALRTQKREKLRQQELEQDMLRRMQMEQKMDLLRQQKQEYMLYQQQLQAQRQQALEQRIKEQALPNYPVTSSYGMYQPAPQYPVSQDTKAPMPDSYTQATYNPAGEVPPQYQTGQPPAYQSVASGAHPIATLPPGAQRQAQPPPYRTTPNQYEPPVTQYQNMSLQSDLPAYQPGVQPAPNQAHQQPNNQPPPSQTYPPHMNQSQQPGMRPQNMQPAVGQPQYPQPGGQAPPPQGLQLQHPSQTNQAPPSNKPQTQPPVGHYQNPAMRGSQGSYLDGDVVADSPQSMGPRQGLNAQGYPMEPEYPSSGPPSFQGQQALQNVYNRTPPSSGPPSLEHFPGQAYNPQRGPPPQQGGPPPQQGGPPPQQGPPPPQQGGPPPPHYGQALQQSPPSSGPSSLQYPNPPSEPTGAYPGSQGPGGQQQQSWGQAPSGNYAPQAAPPPSYPGYEPVQQPYGQPPPPPQQQYYDQNVAEAQLISFD